MYRTRCAAAMLSVAAMAGGSTRVSAQGLAGAAIEGSVVSADGGPVRGAIVSLTESETGSRRMVTTGDRGTYLFENVAVGSYRMEARAIGKLPASREGIVLHLG
ncbi:MAG: carboxypeptidase-like regulatory domain-containing protein, partial [Chloroflexota bacterium]|nr:carboxypeptidase-like regulatory domain-containing protein [Chloroflexota bacterium]